MIKKIVLGLVGLVVLAFLALVLWPEKSYQPYQVDAAYQAQVDNFHVPPFPNDWIWENFAASDGTNLRWGQTGNGSAAKATVIWVPGYTANINMYGEHFDLLARRGYHVIGLDLRGQGGSDRHRDSQPEKLWVKDFSVYSDDLAAFIRSLDLPKDRPVILNGISFGGHVATRALGDHGPLVDGLYLMAPAFRPVSHPYTLEEAMRMMNVARRLGKSKHYVTGQQNWRPDGLDYTQGSDCSSNPKRLYLRDAIFTRHPELRVGGVTNQWGAEFFESSQYLLADGYLDKIQTPVTIISAAYDTFVVTEYNSKACAEALPNCREVVIPNTGHCLPQENDAVVTQMMDEFDRLYDQITSKSL